MDPDEVRDLVFGALSDDEKLENFEHSTIKLVLAQVGWPRAEIVKAEKDLGPAMTWDWFNSLGLMNARVGSTRAFRFRFEDLLLKPHGHPISEAFREFKGDSTDPCCLVFHVFEHGRWVATNLKTDDDPSIHVVSGGGSVRFNVVSFSKFFSNRWRSDHG